MAKLWTPDDSDDERRPFPPQAGAGIALETRKGNAIENSQCDGQITLLMKHEQRRVEELHSPLARRTPENVLYNCHGMVFGSRRCEIWNPREIARILLDDQYDSIPKNDILPGDVVVYFDDDGDAEHSGIVVGKPERLGELNLPPIVVSKWGKGPEYVHFANRCPYNFNGVKYYRIQS